MTISMQCKNDSDYFEIPSGKEIVYNDNEYVFVVQDTISLPKEVYINDEYFDVKFIKNENGKLYFRLIDEDKAECKLPFLDCFGAIKIKMEIDGTTFISSSIAVMVSNNTMNSSVMKMVQYIYDNCEDYLYEQHKYSSISTSIKDSKIISLEAKISYLNKIIEAYKKVYEYLRISPYTKLQKTESVDSFEKLQSISSNTIRYISCHSDELIAVNYYTGIRYNKQYYQPNKTLIEYNTQSYDVYENQVVVGFLRSIVNEITKIINDIQERYYTESRAIIQEGYFDSMYQIFSRSIEKINTSTAMLIYLKSQYQQLYFAFSNLLSIKGYNVTAVPEYTPVFQSISAYNQIYRMIFKWFSCGNYELGKEELLLSFISTSKIYEYYCLIKLLRHFEKINNVKFIKATNMNYHVTDDLYINTKYNNTFFYEKDDVNITIYYQPVIYSNDLAINNIFLFRNNAPNISDKTAIPYYSPDYIIKISKESNSKYIILDAKFSSPKKIREKQLEHLVFKYLFSISPLKENDSVIGLYILCGKKSGSDRLDIVHNIARKINKVVRPFAEIAIMNGFDTNDDSIPQLILKDI